LIKKNNFDLFLLIVIFIFPAITFISNIFGKIDDLIFAYMLVVILFRYINHTPIEKRFFIIFLMYILYSLYLIYSNSLPLRNIFQIFITSKFLIIFLYFYTYSEEYKYKLFNKVIKLVIFIFILSMLVSIVQFIIPQYFKYDYRGINGIALEGIFFSRVLYSEYLVIFIIMLMSFKKNTIKCCQYIIKYRYSILAFSLILLFLTFGRKEIAIAIFLLFILFQDKVTKDSKIIFYLLLFIGILLFIGVFIYIFQEVNSQTFTDKQVRLLILLYGLDVFNYYFPFGSGPGTYGSIMSLQYTDIYEKFDVAKNIYLGWDGNGGPIFDVFIISLIAEYGTGFLFFVYFILHIYKLNNNILISNILNVSKVKICLFIMLLIIMLFVPILVNWIGFLVFTLFGLISHKQRKIIYGQV
jgi:hypothetical protein